MKTDSIMPREGNRSRTSKLGGLKGLLVKGSRRCGKVGNGRIYGNEANQGEFPRNKSSLEFK